MTTTAAAVATGVPPSLVTSWTSLCHAVCHGEDEKTQCYDAASRAVRKLMLTGGKQQEEEETSALEGGGGGAQTVIEECAK